MRGGNGDVILRQVIAHELERKIQRQVDYQLPKRLRLNANNANYITESIGNTNGFNLITARGVNSSDVANGTETPKVQGGSTMPAFTTLDKMGGEAAAWMTLGEKYNDNYPVGRNWRSLNQFLSLPQVNINPTQLLEFHRNGDPFGLGKLIAERVGYSSPSPYDQIKAEHEASQGIMLAACAASYGPSNQFNDLQADLGINVNYR